VSDPTAGVLEAVFLGKRHYGIGQLARSHGLAPEIAEHSRQLNCQGEREGVLELAGSAQRLAAQPESLISSAQLMLD
jgi:hypothetical protein